MESDMMEIELFSQVVFVRDVLDQNARAGDSGTVVEIHHDKKGATIGYEVEIFSEAGETIAVASVPVDSVRAEMLTDGPATPL
jgi:hypothetical protein